MDIKDYKFSVYVGSYKEYNEGSLKGGWITLPVSNNQLQEFLKNTVGIDKDNEEPMIQDWDNDLFHLGEFVNIEKLNEVAKIWDGLSDYQKEACSVCCDFHIMDDIEELANLMLQADEIPYYAYNFQGIEHCADMSEEAKLGYTIAEQNGMYAQLKNINSDAISYFDFEAYGNGLVQSGYYDLSDNGYIDARQDIPDLHYYSYEEMKDMNSVNFKPQEKLSPLQEMKKQAMKELENRTQMKNKSTIKKDLSR